MLVGYITFPRIATVKCWTCNVMLWSLPVSMSVICLRIGSAAAVEIEQSGQRLLSSSQVTAW